MRSGAGIHAQQDVALRAEHLEGFQLREHPLKRLGRMSLRSPQGQGALAGLAGAPDDFGPALLTLAGSSLSAHLAGFLVLTIVGERLELTRAALRSDRVRRLLIAAIAVFAAGLVISILAERTGVRIAGVGLVAQAA
jgi:hypothetical protein